MQREGLADLDWVDGLGKELKKEVAGIAPDLIGLSHAIHEHPELRFEEFQASALLGEFLAKEGFELTSGLAGMETAFRAERRLGSGGPTIGIFCEYDALPGIGHACGHNIIASAGAGAAVAASRWLEKTGSSSGSVVVIGSPGEEGGGGKVHLINGGALEGFDAMVMVHPSGYNAIDRPNLGRVSLEITFTGKASHAAAAPDRGLNALDGATLMLVAVGLLRQQVRSDSRVHAIISDGGQAVNIIPERAQIKLFIRSPDEQYLRGRLYKAIQDCAEGSALATGTNVEIAEVAPAYQSIQSNPVLADVTSKAFDAIGREVETAFSNPTSAGSTDMGNVSRVVPSIHPYICVVPGLAIHTREFEEAAGSEPGDKAVVDGASALATVVAGLITHPDLVSQARKEFEETKESKG